MRKSVRHEARFTPANDRKHMESTVSTESNAVESSIAPEANANTDSAVTGATDTTAASATEGSSIGGEVLSGLLGAGIALACIVPPVIHLVAGPVGPFLGGFVAANRGKPGARGRVIIALTIGCAVAGLLAIAARVFVGLAGKNELPTWFPSSGTLAAILAGVWVYATALGAAGAAVSAALSRKEKERAA